MSKLEKSQPQSLMERMRASIPSQQEWQNSVPKKEVETKEEQYYARAVANEELKKVIGENNYQGKEEM